MPFRGKLEYHGYQLSSVQLSPVQSLGHAWFFATPWNCSTSDFPVHHHLLGLAQAHVQRVGDAIQTSHLLSFPFLWLQSSPASGSFHWVSSSHQVAKLLALQHQSFQWIFRTDCLYYWLAGSPCNPRDSPRVFSSTIAQLSGTQLSLWSNYHPIHEWLLEKL